MNEDTSRPSLQERPNLQEASSSTSATTDDPDDPPQHLVEVLCHEPKWQNELSFNFQALIEKCFDVTLQEIVTPQVRAKGAFELSVFLTNDTEIQQLNREYRQKDKPTNVLSFESGLPIQTLAAQEMDRPLPLGDIALSYETLLRESQDQDKSFQDHFTHLMVHGLLHLLGFDHELEEEADMMEALEIKILKQHFHINNPYMPKD